MNVTSNNSIEVGKAERVRAMFAEIAPRYDFLNHALSLNIDKRWRRFVISKLEDVLARPDARALDLCCGTGDLSLELGSRVPTLGIDFCHPMLKIGNTKLDRSPFPLLLVEGDALKVPVGDTEFDAVTMAFGLRNLESVESGLKEVYRVLRPRGRAAILEFSHPSNKAFRWVFQFYFTQILPKIGNAVSGSSFAYQYLPESVRTFPDQEKLAGMMQAVGFSNITYYNLFGGVVALHLGDKS